jgi:hypothetical protein
MPGATSKENTMDLSFEIEKYQHQGANILMPSTMIGGLSEFHTPVIEIVQLSANPSDGDVYKDTQSGKFRLTKQALVKLANCAGISWHPYETKRVDNRSDRNYVAYQAVGGIRKADGSSIAFKAEYDMDFEVIQEELVNQYTAKAQQGSDEYKKKYIEDSVKREILFKRKHKVKLCESGAMNRVIRSLLGLKNGYTAAELSKPFVTVRIVIRPDYTDKDVRRQMMSAAVKSMTGIYGDEMASMEKSSVSYNGNDIIDIPPDDECQYPQSDAPDMLDSSTTTQQHTSPPVMIMNSQEIDFSNCEQEEQISVLESLIVRKAYDIAAFPKPMAEFNEKNRISLFRKLISMPDAITAKPVDTPPIEPDYTDEVPF